MHQVRPRPAPPSPTHLDAIGQEFDVYSLLLYMKPVYKVTAEGSTVTSDMPLASEPTVISPEELTTDHVTGDYIINCHVNRDEGPPRELHIPKTIKIPGTIGVENPHVYKIANSIEDVPL